MVGERGNRLSLRVLDARGSDALGARLELRLGERRITREVRTAYSYCAASDPRVHVGLGGAAGVEELVVRWPDGERESFGRLDANRPATLRRGEGSPAGR